MKIRCPYRRHLPLLWVVGLSAVVALANDDPKKGRVTTNPLKGNRYSVEQDVDLGRQVSAQAEKELKLLPADHPASQFVRQLGLKLAAAAPGYKFPFTFKVVREKAINAFALPGGPVYINLGMIESANEAELAGVMGHEIAHVVMRHSTRQASRQMKAQIPLAILSGVLGATVGGTAGNLAQLGISIGAGGVFMKYSRDAETEADKVSAQIIYDAGYDPQSMVAFFRKMKEKNGGSGGFLASHPDPGDRAKNVAAILARFPEKAYDDHDSPEFLAAKKAVEDLPVETRQEVASAGPRLPRLSAEELTASGFRSANHSAFRFSYPANWEIVGNANSELTVSPRGGIGEGVVGYGVILSGFQPERSVRSLEDATGQLMASIQGTNPALKPVSHEDIRVANRNAKSVDLTGISFVFDKDQRLTERVRMVVVPGRNGIVLYLLFVAPEPDLPMLGPVFDRMLADFRPH
ncbi:MAG TPA: M48 family metallopeptidase [Candidatus Sulfotelmatobacter sp.]|nr:M48 family metallopeptidase [Candidatus Sulfotelmatobacter sp.]